MDDMTPFEDRFEERLRAFARTGVQPVDSAAVARAAAIGDPKWAATRPARRRLLDEIHRNRKRAVSRTTLVAAAIVAVVALGGALAVIGGPSPTPSVHPSPSVPAVVPPKATASATASNPAAFPRTSGVWIATGSMGTPRSGHTAVRLLDGRVLVAGGAEGDENDTSAELYDPSSGTWSATGSMVKPRAGFLATLLHDGKVLVGDVDGAEVYDAASGTWTVTGKMVLTNPDGTTKYGSATLLRDGRVLVVHEFGSSELYDPDSGTWTTTGQMLEYFHQSRAMVLMPDDKVLEVGGNDGTAYVGYAAELYDPDTGTWTAIANMNGPKEVVSATLLRDGRVLVMDRGFITATSPELYDPATGAWTVTGQPGNRYQSATLLPDGTVLAAGAPGSPDAELYDPATASWTTTGSMLRAHDSSPLTLLLDGTVLVAGGATGSAELYVPAGVSPPPAVAALPSPTPTPLPTPLPTPTPVPAAAGPIPPDARPWKVTVVNRSSQPATLSWPIRTRRASWGDWPGP
jgi:hypothetical protein